MPKLSEIVAAGGVLPALASGAAGKENRGFAFGLIPGLLYKDKYRDDQEDRRKEEEMMAAQAAGGMKKGGKVKKMAKGGSASKRADGCAVRGKTRGRMV
jgi:hypothetical protein